MSYQLQNLFMEPYNMSHGALQHVPWSPCNYVPWTPCNMSHRNMSLATCLQHVPWSPRNMSHRALTTCLMEPSQHVPWNSHNMSHGNLETSPWSWSSTCSISFHYSTELRHPLQHVPCMETTNLLINTRCGPKMT